MSLSLASFPAEATKSISLALALLISSKRLWEKPAPPQLFERTRTLTGVAVPAKLNFACIANSIALIAAETGPVPPAFRNFKLIIFVAQLTPATPSALLPVAPMVPEV